MTGRFRRQGLVAALSTLCLLAGCARTGKVEAKLLREAQEPSSPLERMTRFKVKNFVIGAWCPPSPTETNYRAYINAGFNLVMTYRNYRNPDKEFEIAERLGLLVLIDTYMRNETPWGGIEPDPPPDESLHHRARPSQLRWLLDRYGKSPVLAGVLLGDDIGLPDHILENAEILLKDAPGLFPWYATNMDIRRHIHAPIPMLSTQNYVYVIRKGEPGPVKRQAYCNRLERDRQVTNRFNMVLWPWVICMPEASPSEVRFQVHACVAYGAQGLWYYYFLDNVWDTANQKPGPKHAVVSECNRYITGISSLLIGRRCAGVFHSPGDEQPRYALTPGEDQFIRSMSDGLMAGLLVPEDKIGLPDAQPDFVMVVDKRTVKAGQAEPDEREVAVEFEPDVASISVVASGTTITHVEGPRVVLGLKPGGGVLLAVHRRQVEPGS